MNFTSLKRVPFGQIRNTERKFKWCGVRMRRVNWVKDHRKIRLLTGILLLITVLAVPFIAPVNHYLSIPNQIVAFDNPSEPISMPALGDNVSLASPDGSMQAIDSTKFYAKETGNNELIYEAAGLPLKKVDVSVLEDIRVVPGGQSVAVEHHTVGVHVVVPRQR